MHHLALIYWFNFLFLILQKTLLIQSLFLFIFLAENILICHYLKLLYFWLMLILRFSYFFVYMGQTIYIYLKNFVFALLDPQIIIKKLEKDLFLEFLISVT